MLSVPLQYLCQVILNCITKLWRHSPYLLCCDEQTKYFNNDTAMKRWNHTYWFIQLAEGKFIKASATQCTMIKDEYMNGLGTQTVHSRAAKLHKQPLVFIHNPIPYARENIRSELIDKTVTRQFPQPTRTISRHPTGTIFPLPPLWCNSSRKRIRGITMGEIVWGGDRLLDVFIPSVRQKFK